MILSRIKNIRQNARLKAWMERYERLLVSGFLLSGFLLHYFTFRTLEIGITFIGLGIYAAVAAACILFIHAFDARRESWLHPFLQRLRLLAPLLIQLALGSLLSMSLLFYWFSGSFSVSWPVFVGLVALIAFNERFRHAYLRPVMQMAIFSFVLLSYFTVLFPHVFNSLDASTFLFGGGVSLIISVLLIFALIRTTPKLRPRLVPMLVSVSAVFLVMNALYFSDLIPPIPLSLQEAGVYHSVKRIDNGYAFIGEPQSFWEHVINQQTLHQDANGRVYAFTAIYSPAELNTEIFHVWQRYDEGRKRWVTTDRLSFPIIGGRPDGYRGYTFKTNLAPGKWRVSVETANGQVLGRIRFTFVAP